MLSQVSPKILTTNRNVETIHIIDNKIIAIDQAKCRQETLYTVGFHLIRIQQLTVLETYDINDQEDGFIEDSTFPIRLEVTLVSTKCSTHVC
ncbi:hypothetical protein NC652_014396 [Populus alba x Populus x berolinensis]|uniref:Uncharacterized protein n=1 Tax=Populus alba x Populus x berolinensis TaxID=444605 RepID=A0AAD6QZN4_9ROSI|nr:hypothetical protein NC652_014396 [Populus alba x Populus x berolinensis]KAJ6999110.1 hypothetical protein NC653_015063 [Populus alba x Populus x berolinensis]